MTPILEIAGLTIGLPPGADRANAVQGVNLAVAPNEIVCLVGESGSGKSVIAHATMGLLPRALAVTGGSIRLAGEELVGASERRLEALRCTRMAMIFQEPMTALNPVMRCGDQIDEVLRRHTPLDAAARRAKVLEGLADVRLPDPARMAASYPHQLSGGQRQRIMIAMALVLDPKLLIADEPTTALDVTTQAQILALMRDLMREHGTGVLFITHDFRRRRRDRRPRRGAEARRGRRGRHLRRGAARAEARLHEDADRRGAEHDAAAPRRRHRAAAGRGRGPGQDLRAGRLARRRRDVRAAEDVALTIRRGETLGIVGESGSGKSTVARCIARLVDPTSGSVRIDGLEVAKLPRRRLREMRRKVQIVFQDPYRSLNPRRSVGASIVEGPMNFGLSYDDAMKRARSLMELVRLDPTALERFPHEFSGGQRQRICIARALAMEPALLVADEPVSALDVSVQAQVLGLLDEIRSRLQLTMLFITHDLRVAAQVCDRIAVMRQGRIVEEGPIARSTRRRSTSTRASCSPRRPAAAASSRRRSTPSGAG
jgi:peptide/nickel transport system ATP-binding protein